MAQIKVTFKTELSLPAMVNFIEEAEKRDYIVAGGPQYIIMQASTVFGLANFLLEWNTDHPVTAAVESIAPFTSVQMDIMEGSDAKE